MYQVPDHMTSTGSLSSVTYTFPPKTDNWFLLPSSLQVPEQSDWECEMYGTGRCMVYRPTKGNEPNWFWRKMQYLCFGNKWVKHDSTKNR